MPFLEVDRRPPRCFLFELVMVFVSLASQWDLRFRTRLNAFVWCLVRSASTNQNGAVALDSFTRDTTD